MTIKKKELLAIINYIEHDKGIDRDRISEMIVSSLKHSIQKTLHMNGVEVTLNHATGDLKASCLKKVVEAPGGNQSDWIKDIKIGSINRKPSNKINSTTEIDLHSARALVPQAQSGDFVRLSISQEELGRTTASVMWHTLQQKLQHMSKEALYSSYRDRVGETVTGVVKSVLPNKNVVVDIGKLSAVLPSNHYPRKESYSIGSKVSAVLLEVADVEHGGTELILSRTEPEFFMSLLNRDVPEIKDHTIVVHRIARIPGICTKIVVQSVDNKVDPVGSILGPRGSRIQNIYKELHGERIDVIPYTDNELDLLLAGCAPVKPEYVCLNNNGKCLIVVQDADFPSAIGKEGSGVRVKEQLIGRPIELHRLNSFLLLLNESMELLLEKNHDFLEDKIGDVLSLHKFVLDNLRENEIISVKDLLSKGIKTLLTIDGVTLDTVHKILSQLNELSQKQG